MKKIITFCFYIFTLNSFSQTSLPYITGFDNTTEQAGWTLYRKGSTIGSPWAYSIQSQLPYSGTKCLIHYYPVGEQTLDWFVSPAFDFSAGGKIDTLRFAFTGFSSAPSSSDTVAVFLLSGSPDPDLATAKISLIDFRNANYVNDDVWRDTNTIVIPPTAGLSYIAFKYKGSSSWLDVRFDNLALSSSLAAPIASFTISSNANCIGETVGFTDVSSNNPTSWNWQFVGGSPATATVANPSITYNSPGTYTVSLTSSNSGGSSALATKTIEISECTSLTKSENLQNIKLEIFPNPSRDKITLQSINSGALDFVIYNGLGSQVLSGSLIENKKQTVDITELTKGIYFLKYSDKPGNSQTMKLIKE
jgi:hypothetical protein